MANDDTLIRLSELEKQIIKVASDIERLNQLVEKEIKNIHDVVQRAQDQLKETDDHARQSS